MARPIDEFVLAWDSLSGEYPDEGWRSIPVAPVGTCVLVAGRRFPGNQEALLAGFSRAKVPAAEKLPEGGGFEVCRADPHGDGSTWVALTRKQSGSRELFAEMVADVAGAMDTEAANGEERILRTLLSRVRSWQEFMRKGAQALGPEAEVGLIGELSFLESLLAADVPADLAVAAWVGPLDAPQDFVLGTGAIEVKATIASVGFPAKIGSIDQLDDSVRSPLFLAGVRLSQKESGRSLPEFVITIFDALCGNTEAERLFVDRLLEAGFHNSHADRYLRRFALVETHIFEVVERFPRIIPGNVPDGVRNVVYQVDLDRAPGGDADLAATLKMLGVT